MRHILSLAWRHWYPRTTFQIMQFNQRRTALWNATSKSPGAVANARIVLALLRCIRRLPGMFASHLYEELGDALAPLLATVRTSAVSALKQVEKTWQSGQGPVGFDPNDPDVLHDGLALETIAKGIARGMPAFRDLSRQLHDTLARIVDRLPHPTDGNLAILADLLGLTAADVGFLRIAAACGQTSIDHRLFSFVPRGGQSGQAVEAMCNLRGDEVNRMLRTDGALARSGLLQSLGRDWPTSSLGDLLDLTPMGERLLAIPYASASEMAAAVLSPLPVPSCDAYLDWPHLRRQATLLVAALSQALQQRTPGINILMHGAPGTGKSAFARQLIATIDACGFAINHCNDDGEEAQRSDRLASLRLSQCFAGQRQRAVLVLDEAEDIFQQDLGSMLDLRTRGRRESKAWVNSLLETNAHPVIWITNQVGAIDPAYLRRFAFCLEFPQTPFSLRHKIARASLSSLGCGEETIDVVARDERVTPALLASAARFTELARDSGLGPDASVLSHLDEHARARGSVRPAAVARRTQRFDMRYLNLAGNVTPEGLVSALKGDAATAIVFCGPPGTGKTQLAAELARLMDRQLLVRTASDINSKWYGESEANVAAMFRHCDPKTEMLFLDEAEVLLSARESTDHRADRAVTAEFLRWLEAFEGTFICATNHERDFDPALMRRFAFRLHFQALTLHQRLDMFAEQVLGWLPDSGADRPTLTHDVCRRLERLSLLTPGDFANAGRRARRLALLPHQWIDELEAEHAAKPGASGARIGFM